MATPTLYRHDDASAPVLTGEPGKLIALLDAILVNGYGTKAAAGWTKPFSGTNKAVYLNAGTQTYVRVVDDNASFGTLGMAELFGFDSMSDVDTGTEQFPTPGSISGNAEQRKQITKSITTDGTARKWIALATNRSLILGIEHGTNNFSSAWLYFIGDYISFVPSDISNFMLGCPNWNTDTSPGSSSQMFLPTNYQVFDLDGSSKTQAFLGAIKSAADDATIGVNGGWAGFPTAGQSLSNPGSSAYPDAPHPVYGRPLSDMFVTDNHAMIVRGRLPSIMFASFDLENGEIPHYDSVSISDPNQGIADHIFAGYADRWNATFGTAGGFLVNVDAGDWP